MYSQLAVFVLIYLFVKLFPKKLLYSYNYLQKEIFCFHTIYAGRSDLASYVSQFTVETYCFADGRCLFKQPRSVIYHWNQYDEISKKCRSVRPSVCPFVTLTKKKPTTPSLLTVEK